MHASPSADSDADPLLEAVPRPRQGPVLCWFLPKKTENWNDRKVMKSEIVITYLCIFSEVATLWLLGFELFVSEFVPKTWDLTSKHVFWVPSCTENGVMVWMKAVRDSKGS